MSAAEPAAETPKEEFDAPVHREGAQEEAEPSTVEAAERSTGSVKWFSVTKGKTWARKLFVKVRHREIKRRKTVWPLCSAHQALEHDVRIHTFFSISFLVDYYQATL